MIKAIETCYNGYRFRSRLEARWAVFFDTLGIAYEYEPEGLILSDGTKYLPDFYLIDFHCYFEVKRKSISVEEWQEAKRKISDGMSTMDWAGIIACGDPMDDDLTIFCVESHDGGGGMYSHEVTIGTHPDSGKPYLFAFTDTRERDFYTTDIEGKIPMVTSEYGRYRYEHFVTDRVRRAREKARQAQFEHDKARGAIKASAFNHKLSPGVYAFRVSNFEKREYAGDPSRGLLPCPIAQYTLTTQTPDGPASINHSLFLKSSNEGRIGYFFKSLGMKKRGENYIPDWQGAVGKTVMAEVENDPNNPEFMRVKRFIPQDDFYCFNWS